jgi:hypothetical protein
MSSVIYTVMVCSAMLGNTCQFPDKTRIPFTKSLADCNRQASEYNDNPQARIGHPRRVWVACYQRDGSSSTSDWRPAEDEFPQVSGPPGFPQEPTTTLAQSSRAPKPLPVLNGKDPPSGLPLKWVLVGIVSSLGPYPVALQSYPSLAECKQAVRVMQSTFNSPQPSQAAGDCVGVVLPTSVPR